MSQVYVNGQWLPAEAAVVSALDQGFLYGLGLFETMRVTGARIPLLERHLDRLWRSAPLLGLDLPWPRAAVAAAAREAPDRNRAASGSLRLTVSAGAGGPPGTLAPLWPSALILQVRPGHAYGEDLYARGFTAVYASGRRNHRSPLCRVKSLNCAESLLARREAGARGADEALLLNAVGDLAEGAFTNLFFVSGGRLYTPALDCGALPGVARALVLELAGRVGIPREEGAYRPETLAQADEAFLTNAVMGVMPLTAIEGRPVADGRPGPVTLALGQSCESILS